jgi:5'-phosphate synthase pdxT subunit
MELGVLAIQGDVDEHVHAMRKCIQSEGIRGKVVEVKSKEDFEGLDGLIIPGGESTTVGKLLKKYELVNCVSKASKNIAVFGTCAGMVLLCKGGGGLIEDQPLLGLVDAKVQRNAFGRQKESFEADLDIEALGAEKFPGVFIRAPALTEVSGKCESLCKLDGLTVLARQGRILLSSFHPELSDDMRVHKYFLRMVCDG